MEYFSKMDHKIQDGLDRYWIDLAQGTDKWRALVRGNEFPDPQNAGNLLTRGKPVVLFKRTLTHLVSHGIFLNNKTK
jgi:hypothetical protein